MGHKEKLIQTSRSLGRETTGVICLALLSIFVGLLLLLAPKIQMIHVCYFVGGLFVIVGIVYIVKYFVNKFYENLNHYGFTIGAVLLVLGLCCFIKVEVVALLFHTYLGYFILFTSIIKLQNAIDLFSLKSVKGGVHLVIALVLLIMAIVIIVNPFQTQRSYYVFTYITLVIDGVIAIVNTICLTLHLRHSVWNEKSQSYQIGSPMEEANKEE